MWYDIFVLTNGKWIRATQLWCKNRKEALSRFYDQCDGGWGSGCVKVCRLGEEFHPDPVLHSYEMRRLSLV